MSYPHYDLVLRAYDELKAEGKIAPRADQEAVEQDKGLLTARAAYLVNMQHPTIGLLYKPSGNNYQQHSVDWHVRNSDGEGWDVATDEAYDGQRQAVPMNGGPYGPDPARIADWRQPTAELAQISSTPPPEPVPVPPPVDYLARLDTLEANVLAHDDANTQRIIDRIDHIVADVDAALDKAVALILLKRRREDEPVP